MKFTLGSIVASITVMTSLADAAGQVAQVVDSRDFCVFLPPTDSTDRLISDTEWNANAFCMGSTPKATGADKMPDGFIQSAHFVSTSDYVQVTGQIDPSKANLDPTDDGGQYDVKAPNGASCAGWKYFVNLIEPSGNTYCIRCCNDQTNCNRGISEKGCDHIIPGDYSGPMGSGGSSSPSSGSNPTTTSSSSTTTNSQSTAATYSSQPFTNPQDNSQSTTTTTTTTTNAESLASTTTTNTESLASTNLLPGTTASNSSTKAIAPSSATQIATAPSSSSQQTTNQATTKTLDAQANTAVAAVPSVCTLIAIMITLLISM